MRTRDNGFNRFMCKLEGRPFESWCKWSIQEFESVDVECKTSLELVLSRRPSYLIGAFAWRTTPQGHDYWLSRYEKRTPMSDEDYLFLRKLLEVRFP